MLPAARLPGRWTVDPNKKLKSSGLGLTGGVCEPKLILAGMSDPAGLGADPVFQVEEGQDREYLVCTTKTMDAVFHGIRK